MLLFYIEKYPNQKRRTFMSKSKKIYLSFVILITLMLLVVFSVSFSPALSPSRQTMLAEESPATQEDQPSPTAENDTLAGKFDIKITSRSGQNIILSNPVSYDDGQAYRTYWSQAQTFSISFNVDPDSPPPSNSPDPTTPSTYDLTLNVNYLKGYLDNNQFVVGGVTQYFEDVYTINVDNYEDFSDLNYQINIDEGLAEDVNWGIYQFVIDINGAQATSLYYAIEPTTIIAQEPVITYTIPSSATGSLGNLYRFTLENIDTYRYVDERNLTWYVWGQSIDGIRYALTSEDLVDDTFVALSCTQPLVQSGYDRNGTTFEIEFNNDDGLIYGEWHVWCEYNYPTALEPLESNHQTINIEAPFDYINVVYIIAGVAGLALIITIVIAVVKNKKEKVW